MGMLLNNYGLKFLSINICLTLILLIMKKMNENQLQNLEAGKFWGSETTCTTHQYLGEYCCTSYYVFWVVVSKTCGYGDLQWQVE